MDRQSDYERMAHAIEWLAARADAQPGLEETAAAVGLSQHHFQRVFSRWVGVSPKRFLQALTVERAKRLLAGELPVLAVADEVGLSSGSRLHDHFVSLEAATPGEYGARGAGIEIRWGRGESPFGPVFVAVTPRGICRLAFLDGSDAGLSASRQALSAGWPRATLHRDDDAAQRMAERVFTVDAESGGGGPLSLHVDGTNFQMAVWRALLDIPAGHVTSYARLAERIGRPSAARAVGTAVGANPIAFAIPCHRVIRQTGELGGYRWGETRKHAIHVWESARIE